MPIGQASTTSPKCCTEQFACVAGPLQPSLVEAAPLAVPRVAEVLHEAAGVEVGAARAVLVDRPAVGELRPPELVERRKRAERRELEDDAEEVVGVRRAARDRDDRLALQHLRRARRAGRVRVGGRDPAPRRAGADRDDRPRLRGDGVRELEGRLPADLAVDAVVLHGDRALDDEDVLPLVRLHRVLEALLRLVPGGGQERLVVVERDEVEDQRRQRRVRRAQERLGAAGALLEVEPDDRRLQLLLDRGLRHLFHGSDREPDGAAAIAQTLRKSRRSVPVHAPTTAVVHVSMRRPPVRSA